MEVSVEAEGQKERVHMSKWGWSLAHMVYILTTNEMCFALLAEVFSDSERIVFWGSLCCQFTSEEQGEVSSVYCKIDWKELAGPEQSLASGSCGHSGFMHIIK